MDVVSIPADKATPTPDFTCTRCREGMWLTGDDTTATHWCRREDCPGPTPTRCYCGAAPIPVGAIKVWCDGTDHAPHECRRTDDPAPDPLDDDWREDGTRSAHALGLALLATCCLLWLGLAVLILT